MEICKVRQINKNTYLFTDMSLGWYYNSTVIFTEEGPIIIDVFRDKEQFNEVKKFINEKGFNKPAAIIYTHWHSDHTTGNKVFNDCRIIAHKSTVTHLEKLKKKLIDINREDSIPMMPNETFEEKMKINIGNKLLRLIHCPGHTFDSILVYDKDDKLLIAGDNLVSKEVDFCLPPVIPSDNDVSMKELEQAYKIIEGLKTDVIIPGHGCILEPQKLIDFNKRCYYKCLKEGSTMISAV
ncbi:MBL fold metallo-hydrolase [Haloimpatiens sp. FM7330]|uniref:MBL fold metallo-hydrolase n=1 Tax=Haloimpatiens sp. FM7330 TaxID=3298610 RepID=UPI003631930C